MKPRLTARLLEAMEEALSARLAGGFGPHGGPEELDCNDEEPYDGPTQKDYDQAQFWVSVQRHKRKKR